MSDAKADEFDPTDQLCVNTIGVLAADMVEEAQSGHPGAPMGLNAVAHVLWSRYMIGCGKFPNFPNRDRFVLSNGHACALLYCMLHLTNYSLTMDDLISFRQLDSKAPGHPECHITTGVEVTTGPLGQGIAQGVGLAIAAKHIAARFNRPDFDLFNNKIYVICGDGCMMEGISSEAASLAGHLQLNNLILIYDDNNITIDGHTNLAFTERVPPRFESYGWKCINVSDGNTDINGINEALEEAQNSDRPVLISVKTIIGYGCSKQNTHGVHGSKLGTQALNEYKLKFGFKANEKFIVDEKVYQRYASTYIERGNNAHNVWSEILQNYCEQYPDEGKLLQRMIANELPPDIRSLLPKFDENSPVVATRNLSGEVLNVLAILLPELIGGSADLTTSNKTAIKDAVDFQADSYHGRYIRFGIREFAMFAIGNGISAYRMGLIPFTATFLNFLTYGYGAVRLGSLSCLRQIYIMTHDSIFLGEDGPTHQPVEVLATLRALPNCLTFRPCDGNEVNGSYLISVLNVHGPSCICLSRQKVKPLGTTSIDGVIKGAYVVCKEEKECEVILIATGSEVEPCVSAAQILSSEDAENRIDCRVVSAPCLELFDDQSMEYKRAIMTFMNEDGGSTNVLVVSVEASAAYGWSKYSHCHISVPAFGTSAPLSAVIGKFGFSAEKIAERVVEFKNAFDEEVQNNVPLLPCLYPCSMYNQVKYNINYQE